MDPITVILSALATAGGNVAGQAISDTYALFKRRIIDRFGGGNPRLEQHLDDYVADQETYAKPAEKALRDAGVGDDEEIVKRAIELLEKAEEAQPGITGGLVGQINAEGVVVAHTVHGGVHFGRSR